MTEKERLIEKVRKLFRLAGNNPSQQESEAAMVKAQRLLSQGGLSMGDVEEQQKTSVEMALNLKTKGFAQWQANLLLVVVENFRCASFVLNLPRKKHRKLVIVGFPQDVEVSGIIFMEACEAAERAWKLFLPEYKRAHGGCRHPKRLRNDFMFSFVQALKSKFQQNVEVHDLHPVIVTPPEVRDHMESRGLSRAHQAKVLGTGSMHSRLAGWEAGSKFRSTVGTVGRIQELASGKKDVDI